MAKGPRYRVPYRRRREAKTDYAARRILATSEKPRLVVRPSDRNITIQLMESKIIGDIIITQAHSSELKKYGWKGGLKNTPAAYLLGFLAGRRAVIKEIVSANLDLGLKRPTKGSKIFAAVKGALDAGLKVPCNLDILPDSERIEGRTIAEYAKSIENPDDYKYMFSAYLRRGLEPQELPEHFASVKKKMEESQ
ncbi:ribosomal protein L18 [Thaumarchaeota archaeon SCGC AB-539-E09]|nr:ribosomal protein L18 [Thaumarchaeota archaeon SCGC AB-539-E09]